MSNCHLDFTKMHGLGNDFVLLDCRRAWGDDADFGALARRLCRRNDGIGADGILVLCLSAGADFRMRIFNADGSEAQMCGNGIRCISKYVYDHSATPRSQMTVETLAGLRRVSVVECDPAGRASLLSVDMGRPVLEPDKVPVKAAGARAGGFVTLHVASGATVELMPVSMGNPHGVIFVDDVDVAPVESLGSELECHCVWPEKANIQFTQLMPDGSLAVRAWERGAGETQACGTGACAAAVAAVISGRTAWPVTVRLRGGDLLVDSDCCGRIIMTGPAAEVFCGRYPV